MPNSEKRSASKVLKNSMDSSNIQIEMTTGKDNSNSTESLNHKVMQTIYRCLEKTKISDHSRASDVRVSTCTIRSTVPDASNMFLPKLTQPPALTTLSDAKTWKRTKEGLKVQNQVVNTLPNIENRDKIKQRFINRADIQTLYVPPLNQVDLVTDHLILTGYGALFHENFENLPFPVKSIVNVTFELPLYKMPSWDAYRVPVNDTEKDSINEFFKDVAELIQWNAQNNHCTIVHCMAGVSRSATCVMAYLIMCMGFSLEQAFVLTRSKRSVIRPKLNFLRQLTEFEKIHIPEMERHTQWIDVTKGEQTVSFPKFIVDQFMDDYSIYFEDE